MLTERYGVWGTSASCAGAHGARREESHMRLDGYRRRARWLGAIACSLAVVAAGCGGGGGGQKKTATTAADESTTSTSTGETTTSVLNPTATSTAAGGVTTTAVKSATGATSKTATKATASTAVKPKTQGNLLNVQATTSSTASGKTPQPGGKITVGVA